jgi:hypothetical protein
MGSLVIEFTYVMVRRLPFSACDEDTASRDVSRLCSPGEGRPLEGILLFLTNQCTGTFQEKV